MPDASPGSHFTSWSSRLWHLPDRVSWMDPLPAPHRRGIIAAALLMLLAFLWPYPSKQHSVQPVTPLHSGSVATEAPLQAQLTDSSPSTFAPQSDADGQWRNYTVASGQTLAQLFRDNNLPVTDVFAMAQVEGNNKPLSTLHSGQTVKIRQNTQGVVTGLTLEGANGNILFTRQPDGSFIQAP
ncbi:LysM-like peptidoglycan-binding domain-containing protein [Erwinia pyrifoliae]|uniref:LysM-like peptidoglycan-binding domain-containing protein n=1 Tax=Erwinia pyrifoliae TaxID=79967 RepID=UPI0021FE73CB|nr:LysM-like peptidoglycan-binding domain-containing protein [Erwinia pyrifoliae]UWS28865.1 Opacity-associated protein A [Erwinia pyrifoliae]